MSCWGALLLWVCVAGVRCGGALGFDRVHAFYYLWYGQPAVDGRYLHWNHEVLPHWHQHVNALYPNIGQRFSPPLNLHSSFYPLRGPYSSNDPHTMLGHFLELRAAGIGVIVVSWWGQADQPHATDTQGVNTDRTLRLLLDALDSYNSALAQPALLIALHLEPYPSRSVESVREDLEYLHALYGAYRSLYRMHGRPVFYVYDSYHLPAEQWGRLLVAGGDLSIRGTVWDGVFFGLWLDRQHGDDLAVGGFDGVYSYFASEGFSYGSTSRHWPGMCAHARARSLLCSLSVGPGYDDGLIRPWNKHNVKPRDDGRYYEEMWANALLAHPDVVSITSFNEWGEGTQIEPASCKEVPGRTYACYRDPHLYTNITAWKAAIFEEQAAGPAAEL